MTVLFFEPHITGHRQEYLNHLIEYVSANASEHEYFFVVHPNFVLQQSKLPQRSQQVRLVSCNLQPATCNLLINSIRTFRLAHHFATKHHANHLCFLNFNDVQFALGLFRPKYSISGILFKPFGPKRNGSILQQLTWQRKYFQTWLYTWNKRIKTVFVLNDHKAEDFLNSTLKTVIFQMLPDPVPELIPEPGYNLRDKFSIPANHKIFLHIGSLLKRKGTLDILDSLQYLSEDDLSKFTLLILGFAEPDMDHEITDRLSTLHLQQTTLSSPRRRGPLTRYPIPDTRYLNTFLPPQVFKATLDQSDLVLVPYKYPESSSGLAGHAISAGKPLLAIRKGLLGDTVAEHGTGIFIDECTPMAIAEGIKRALSANLKGKVSKRYLQSHTKEIFSRLMIEAITR
jgi:glycosyltransferase involved in cell wall biosynthesis